MFGVFAATSLFCYVTVEINEANVSIPRFESNLASSITDGFFVLTTCVSLFCHQKSVLSLTVSVVTPQLFE